MIRRALLFSLLWWVLVEGRLDSWLLGSLAVVAATGASVALRPPEMHGLRLGALPGFAAYFLVNSVRGGWHVALMALRGRAALQPAFMELPMRLPAGAPQVLVTSVLGLMPGTLGVELAGDRLRLHVLDERLPIARETEALEERVGKLFGVPP